MWLSPSVTTTSTVYDPALENEYASVDPAPSDAPLTVHAYEIVPVPPDSEAVKVTLFPMSVGFWELLTETDGLLFMVTVTDAEYVCPNLSVTVTSTVYVPALENE